jgi:hypothetical protein
MRRLRERPRWRAGSTVGVSEPASLVVTATGIIAMEGTNSFQIVDRSAADGPGALYDLAGDDARVPGVRRAARDRPRRALCLTKSVTLKIKLARGPLRTVASGASLPDATLGRRRGHEGANAMP